MKSKKFILVFFFQFLYVISFCQPWYITRGLNTDEVAWAVDADSAGNIYWAIEEKDQWPYWYYNIVLFKIDPNGQQVWQSNPYGNGTGFNDIAFKASVKAPYVYLSGRTDSTASPVSGDALVTSYNLSNGGFNWAYSYEPLPDYGYEEIDGLVVQPDGIYLSGWKQQQGTNDVDILIQKIDFSGQPVWSNTWDYNSLGRFDGANGHMVMDNNYLYVAAHVNRTNIASFDGDGALVCFSRSNGAYQWHETWGGSSFDDALGMTMSSDSMIYVVGYTASYGNGSQAWVNKYSRTGQLKWSRMWGGTGAEITRCTVTDGDSIIYVVGTTSSYGSGVNDIFVLKIDSSGIFIDSLFWGGAYDEVAHDVTMYGPYMYITGDTKSFGNGQINGDHKTDGLLLKINGRTMQAPDTIATGTVAYNEKFDVNIFPNPSDGDLNIAVSESAIIEIINIQGRIVGTEILNEKANNLDVSFLSDGIYILRIKTDMGIAIRKFVKN